MPPPGSQDESCPVGGYFTGLADLYAGHRPSYPRAAIRAAVEGLNPPVRCADVGCGTGISARLLAGAGCEVTGIDPNEDMLQTARRQSAEASPPITYRRAAAEQTGLPDASLDLVLCAQAFHWFEAPAALAEFNRILSPGGRLALMWNVRGKSDPFTAGYNAVTTIAQADAQRRGRVVARNRSHRPDDETLFTNVRTLTFDNPQRLDRPALLGRARSASYFPPSGPLRSELEETLQRLFAEHEQDGFVNLLQQTELTLADAVKQP